MIILKEDGQVAEFYDRYDIPRPSNLCQLFWYTLGVSFAFTGVGVVLGLTLMGYVMLFVYWQHLSVLVAFTVTVLAIIAGAGIYHDRYGINPKGLLPSQWRENISVAYEGFTKKFCPLVSYKETD